MNRFSEIDALCAQLNKCRPLTEGEVARLRDEFLIEFTYNSNAIEGNTLTLQETALVLNEGVTIAQKPLKDHLEAIGHKEAYLYVEDLVISKTPLSETIIKRIHSLVLADKPQDKGVYRSISVRIMGAAQDPPQPYLVPVQMEQLMLEYQEWKETMPPIERIALFHLKLEGIHPFIDGNGRTGRLLLNLELMQERYPTINVKFADRQKYYDCFSAYYGGQDTTAMTQLLATYVKERLSEYIRILR